MGRKGVFKIINLKTGKVYVGSSNSNVDQRLYDYWQNLHSGTHHNSKLQNDFNRYGSSNFKKVIISANCNSEADVRRIRDRILYQNRAKTYNNLDANVSFKGGNPNARFEGSYDKRNTIMEELIGIIDKAHLNSYDTQNLKNRVKSGSIQNKSQLNQLIKTYYPPTYVYDDSNQRRATAMYRQAKKEMLLKVEKSNLNEETKNILISKINEGKFTRWNKHELYEICDNFEKISRRKTLSTDVLLDVQITLPLNDSHTGKTIKELLIELQKLNLITYWKREYWKIVFDIGILEYENLYLLEKIYIGIKKDINAFKMKNKKRILDSIPKGSKFNKSIRALANDYCKIFSLNCWTFLNKSCILFYKNSSIVEVQSVTTLLELMNEEYDKFLPENRPGWLSLNRRTWDKTKERLEKDENLECNHTNKKITKNKCANCGYILEQEKCPYCYNKEEQKDINKQKNESYKIKQLIKFVDKFKSSINNELKEELIKDIKDGKITSKSQISKRAIKTSTKKNNHKNETQRGNKNKKNIVDFGKRNKEKEKEKEKQLKKRLETKENLQNYVNKFKSTITKELKEELIKDIQDGKITSKTQIARRAMKEK